MSDIFIFGCGDLGSRVARLCQDRAVQVIGIVRTAASLARLQEAAIEGIGVDLDEGRLAYLPSLTGAGVYYFVPPPAHGVSDPRLDRLLRHLGEAPPRKILYVSTSGVYGDCGGAWIDEDQPARPATDRARRRLWAERRLRAFGAAAGTQVVIVRVPGIYGPGRLPLDRLRRGEPVLLESECPYTNRIHVDDLAQVCLAAMERANDGATYNAADGHPGTMTSYFNAIADLFGLPRPPQISMVEARRRLSPGMLSYLGESRRICNRRMLRELGVELRYPDLSHGLASCLPPRPAP